MAPRTRWRLPEPEPHLAGSLASALDLPPVVARVLAGRGSRDAAAARAFLEAPLGGLHDPFLLSGMTEAVGRLREAIRKGQSILLYGDYDVDGVASVVILKTAIERAGGRASFHVPNRLREGYGLHAEAIEQAARAGVKLLISADTGIRAPEAIAKARVLGMDVIVTDHHLPDAGLPPACAVLNPKRADCPYPEKDLCGAGVAFKLVEALLRTLNWPAERIRKLLESLMKLVAIATVADVVPLTGENRILVKHGLEGLRCVRNPGLRALLDVAGFTEGEAPSARQVAFRIAPRMNAAGRMAEAGDVIELLTTRDGGRARRIAAHLHALNQERQQAEAGIVQAILAECDSVPVSNDRKALVFSGVNWHRGVVGIVASRLVERFHRPVIVLGEDPETGLARGSGRSIAPFHLLEAIESMPGLFAAFGGHRQAVGVTLAAARVPELRRRLEQCAGAALTDHDLTPVLRIDAVIDLCDLTGPAIDGIFSLAPFGFGNPEPVLALMDATVAAEPVVMKERHLRFSVGQAGRVLGVKAWNFAGRAAELRPGARIDLALSIEPDAYALKRGCPGWSATAVDVRAAGRRESRVP